jgi:chromosome segregation protein
LRLKSLKLFGFKTFAEQTSLEFEPGITALVGPNGSGKSNLVDAIRWALGEQSSKSLRSTKTEDVIFAGNERRKPLGMAEVALTFDNGEGLLKVDASEVQITRRAYRAGESGEYFINRQQVRLRDVVELLMGTGLGPGSYAIVSQGQIDSILSSKPVERRSLFEETAGINRFLARKNESLRRLEGTEQNAIRVNDLLAEIGTRVPELETQARRAKRFRKATARLRDLEILSYVRASSSRRVERDRLQAELDRLNAERTGSAAKAATLDAELAAQRSALYAHELALENARDAANAARAQLAELETLHASLVVRREALEGQSANVTDDRERALAERASLERTIAALEAQAEPNALALESERERERASQDAVAAARTELDRVFAALREVEAQAASAAASEAERRAQLAAAHAECERLERETSALRDEARQSGERAATLARGAAGARAELALLQARSEAAHEAAALADGRVAEAAEALAAAQSALRTATSELAGAEARLHTLEELEANLEGHIPGTRAVLEAHGSGDLGGIYGVISNLIRVDERYARALDAAFGGGLSNIVTDTSEHAQRAIEYLRANELGRATFLPLDTLGKRAGRDPQSAPHAAGVIGYAHTLVETQPQFKGIVAFLVGRILVVEHLDVGVRLVRPRDGREPFRDTIVTLDGDQISGGGAMTGGRYRRERSILSRRAQLETLREQLPQLRAAHARSERDALGAAEANAAAMRERDERRRAANELTIALRDAGARHEALAAEHARIDAEIAATLERANLRGGETVAARERLALLERPGGDPAAVTVDRERLEAELAGAREGIALAQDGERAVAARIAGHREALAALWAQREAARSRLELLEADRERASAARDAMTAELASIGERIVASEGALERARRVVNESVAAGDAGRRERDAMTARAAELDAQLRLAQSAERESAVAAEAARLRLAEIDAELGMLAAQFAQNPATAGECADVEARYASEDGEFGAEIARLREDLARLQNVNLNAEAEIVELVERERFLREQLEDLARARETLLASIKEIESSSQEQFNAVFAAVQEQFSIMFARLFPGGEAKMWQTNPEDLSETGIEISVQPPGKKMMLLAALSGGERAMTAAALIFALIKVRPSPFYLLDEVDAALDDANVDRFSTIVREVASAAQLLIVTHNKKTMELAQRMYGVTMAEPGISSVISADLTPLESTSEERVLAG